MIFGGGGVVTDSDQPKKPEENAGATAKKPSAVAVRKDRRAQALRANLQRRKASAQAVADKE
jgi:hypothetical protein